MRMLLCAGVKKDMINGIAERIASLLKAVELIKAGGGR
jgi:hypothetical protein